jgi:hypothetical protein
MECAVPGFCWDRSWLLLVRLKMPVNPENRFFGGVAEMGAPPGSFIRLDVADFDGPELVLACPVGAPPCAPPPSADPKNERFLSAGGC